MTLSTGEKHFRLLHAPQENRAAVVHPAWDRVSDLIGENISLQSQADYDMQGRKLSAICRQARLELLDAARGWTAAYRNVGPTPDKPSGLIFLAGHQPQIFHPGVWLKNFALGRLADQHRATAVNLIVDSDAISLTSLRVPGGTAEKPTAAQVAFDRPDPAIPYEERRVEDRPLFDSFAERVLEQMAQLIPHPLMEKFWPLAIGQSHQTGRLGAGLARARHLIEAQWGLTTLEIPQSRVCELDCFHWFVAHLLARLGEFSAVYNEAVREYRRLYRIRSASHPVPNLSTEGEWLEAPFWIWSKENPRRRRLFAKHSGDEVLLTDRQDINARLPLSAESDASRAVERLADLARSGMKIRSRALVTTLWARLALGDLFIHGIGGGNYDLVTDRIIERFFHRTPPGFMILSATLHLPVNRPSPLPTNLRSVPGEGQGEGDKIMADPTTLDRQLRELTYHPERFLDDVFDKSKYIPGEVQELIKSKRQWIETPQTIENARTRCQAIRQNNESLQPWLEDRRRQLLNRRAQAVVQQQTERILSWREYGFCLYPEETLRDFMDTLLPQ
ncbi:MAG: hypothetical protein ABSA77_02235 [Thermoguttaceae bacterium]|jgi:hypothetical protein